MDVKTLIKQYLKTAKLMQLATSNNNQPWACNVWFAVDDEMSIYWFSSPNRRHSQEIIKNNKVAAAISLPHVPNDPARGIQLQGVAELLIDKKEINKAISVYVDRIFTKEKIQELMDNPIKPHNFYKITPTQYVLFDTLNFPDESRRELNL